MSAFTAVDKLEAIERELRMRHRVFDRKVLRGEMTKEKRDYEIAVFEAIAADYRAMAERERLL